MEKAQATVLCNNQQKELYPNQSDYNCQMFVEHSVLAGQISFITIERDMTVNLEKLYVDAPGNSIENDELILTYVANSTIEAGAEFILTDKITGESNPVGFSLRYWQGYQQGG